MKVFVFIIVLMSENVFAQKFSESFLIKWHDQFVFVSSPIKKSQTFSVNIENQSLNKLLLKFEAGGKILKFVSLEAQTNKGIEIINQGNKDVVVVPLSPAFQEFNLIFGKEAYEIPKRN